MGTETIQPEGFLILKEVEGGASISTLRTDVLQSHTGLSGANAKTAMSRSLKECQRF